MPASFNLPLWRCLARDRREQLKLPRREFRFKLSAHDRIQRIVRVTLKTDQQSQRLQFRIGKRTIDPRWLSPQEQPQRHGQSLAKGPPMCRAVQLPDMNGPSLRVGKHQIFIFD